MNAPTPSLDQVRENGRGDDDATRYAQAIALCEAGNQDGCCAILLDLAERNTPMWEPYNDLGVLSLQHGDANMAIHFMRLAIEREPAPGAATANLSQTLMQAGRFDEAADLWVRVLSDTPARAVMDQLSAFLSFAPQQEKATSAFFDKLKNEWLTQSDPALTPTEYQRVPYGSHLVPIARFGDLPGAEQVLTAERAAPREATFHFRRPSLPRCEPFPQVRRYSIAHAYVRPVSDTICQRDRVLVANHTDLQHHLLFDTGTGFCTPFPAHGFATVRRERVVGHLDTGVVLTAYASVNWAHFITELLPHVVLTERCGLPHDVPLIISDEMHPNMLNMVTRLKSPRRELVRVRGNTCVREATIFDPVTTVPYDYCASVVKAPPTVSGMDCLFSEAALGLTREATMRAMPVTHGGPKRIFIDRKSAGRRIINRAEVADFFASIGFAVVEPEKLDVQGQINAFANADLIVGQSGAGLANMLFAKPGTRIVVLTLDSPYTIFSYFTNMASALGHDLHYLGFAPSDHSVSHPGHADMHVDIAQLRRHAELFEL